MFLRSPLCSTALCSKTLWERKCSSGELVFLFQFWEFKTSNVFEQIWVATLWLLDVHVSLTLPLLGNWTLNDSFTFFLELNCKAREIIKISRSRTRKLLRTIYRGFLNFRKTSISARKHDIEILLQEKLWPNIIKIRHEVCWSGLNTINFRHSDLLIQFKLPTRSATIMGKPFPDMWGNRFRREFWPNYLLDSPIQAFLVKNSLPGSF